MNDILDKAIKYKRNYAIVGRAHYLAADAYARYNRLLGIPVIVITAVIGSTIFGTIGTIPGIGWKIAAGLISLLAAILSSLQMSLKFSEISEKHKMAGGRYRAASRRLSLFHLKYSTADAQARAEALAELAQMDAEWTQIASESPAIPDAKYYKAEREFDQAANRQPQLRIEQASGNN
jgi:hypothetical protein